MPANRNIQPDLNPGDSTSHTDVCLLTVGDLIRWYLRTFEKRYNWRRSKSDHLRFLARQSVARLNASTLTADELRQYVWQRRAMGASEATALSDLSRISVVLTAAKKAGGTSAHPEVVEEALSECHENGLLTNGAKRTRRPTSSEIDRLDQFFQNRSRGEIPMHDILWFAIHSARQESEICQLVWLDLDPKTQTGCVSIVSKQGAGAKRQRFRFTDEAWAIAQRQPVTNERIFPYHPQSIGKAFRIACQALGIDDLSFRDLRFDAAVRLFEKGLSIFEVAEITLIQSQSTLSSYASMSGRTLELLKHGEPNSE